jgi:hypothetical protein
MFKLKRRKIKELHTSNLIFRRCGKKEFIQRPGLREGCGFNECSIKHLGRQIYLVGYFDHYKNGGSSPSKNYINQYMILFPSEIKKIIFE